VFAECSALDWRKDWRDEFVCSQVLVGVAGFEPDNRWINFTTLLINCSQQVFYLSFRVHWGLR
jgi:hypothetical protein